MGELFTERLAQLLVVVDKKDLPSDHVTPSPGRKIE
jgi:hypothetical protein